MIRGQQKGGDAAERHSRHSAAWTSQSPGPFPGTQQLSNYFWGDVTESRFHFLLLRICQIKNKQEQVCMQRKGKQVGVP